MCAMCRKFPSSKTCESLGERYPQHNTNRREHAYPTYLVAGFYAIQNPVLLQDLPVVLVSLDPHAG